MAENNNGQPGERSLAMYYEDEMIQEEEENAWRSLKKNSKSAEMDGEQADARPTQVVNCTKPELLKETKAIKKMLKQNRDVLSKLTRLSDYKLVRQLALKGIQLHDVLEKAVEAAEASPELKAFEDISQVLASGLLADVTLLAGGKAFAAHKLILSARSPVFAAMFAGDASQEKAAKVVPINDMGADVFASFLAFVYTGQVPSLQPHSATELLAAAEKYQLQQLKSLVEDYLCAKVSCNSASSILALAESANAPRLKERCLELIKKQPLSAKVAQLPELVLFALFKQLPPTDKMGARKVCRRWDELVPVAARSTRSLNILVGDFPMFKFEFSFNRYSIGSHKVVKLLKQENGSPLVPIHRFTEWNTLEFASLDEDTIKQIAATFPGVLKLQFGLYDVHESHIRSLITLLKHWRHQLVSLTFYENSDFTKADCRRLYTAINGLSSLTSLTLILYSLPILRLPIASQLLQLNMYAFAASPQQVAIMLQKYAASNNSLRIEHINTHQHHAFTHFMQLTEPLRDSFTQLHSFFNPFDDVATICTNFRNLAYLYFNTRFIHNYRTLLGQLSSLSHLIYLSFDELPLFMEEEMDEESPEGFENNLLLPQLKSVKAIAMHLAEHSHWQLASMELAWTMPNIEAIEFQFGNPNLLILGRPIDGPQCTECNVSFNVENLQEDARPAQNCLRQMFGPLKASCNKLGGIIHNREEILGTAEELLAE